MGDSWERDKMVGHSKIIILKFIFVICVFQVSSAYQRALAILQSEVVRGVPGIGGWGCGVKVKLLDSQSLLTSSVYGILMDPMACQINNVKG